MTIITKDGVEYFEIFGNLVPADKFLHDSKLCQLDSESSSLINFPQLHSEALAVHPNQIQEARESARKKGIPTEFDKLGRPVFTSSRHFKAYAKAYGFVHKGY